MALGTDEKNPELGNLVSKIKTIIVKAKYTAGSAPVPSNLVSLSSGSLDGSTEKITLDFTNNSEGEVDEIIKIEDVSATNLFDGTNGVAATASLVSGNIEIDAEAEDATSDAEATFLLIYKMK